MNRCAVEADEHRYQLEQQHLQKEEDALRDRLKPCPFCGSVSVTVKEEYGAWVTCEECDAEGPPGWQTHNSPRSAMDHAIELWNNRRPTK